MASTHTQNGHQSMTLPAVADDASTRAIEPILNTREVVNTLHGLMKSVTQDAVTPSTVEAACKCAHELTALLRVCVEAARLQHQR